MSSALMTCTLNYEAVSADDAFGHMSDYSMGVLCNEIMSGKLNFLV